MPVAAGVCDSLGTEAVAEPASVTEPDSVEGVHPVVKQRQSDVTEKKRKRFNMITSLPDIIGINQVR